MVVSEKDYCSNIKTSELKLNYVCMDIKYVIRMSFQTSWEWYTLARFRRKIQKHLQSTLKYLSHLVHLLLF